MLAEPVSNCCAEFSGIGQRTMLLNAQVICLLLCAGTVKVVVHAADQLQRCRSGMCIISDFRDATVVRFSRDEIGRAVNKQDWQGKCCPWFGTFSRPTCRL